MENYEFARMLHRMQGVQNLEYGKPIARNTRAFLVYDPEHVLYISVELHTHEIVRLYPNGTAQIFMHGYDTPLTRDRICDACNVSIYQKRGEQLVGSHWRWRSVKAGPLLFDEGMLVDGQSGGPYLAKQRSDYRDPDRRALRDMDAGVCFWNGQPHLWVTLPDHDGLAKSYYAHPIEYVVSASHNHRYATEFAPAFALTPWDRAKVNDTNNASGHRLLHASNRSNRDFRDFERVFEAYQHMAVSLPMSLLQPNKYNTCETPFRVKPPLPVYAQTLKYHVKLACNLARRKSERLTRLVEIGHQQGLANHQYIHVGVK